MEELPSTATMGPVLASELLADVAGLRRQTGRPTGLWPPLVCFGLVVAVTGGTLTLSSAPWWSVQLAVGLAMIAGGLALRFGPEAR